MSSRAQIAPEPFAPWPALPPANTCSAEPEPVHERLTLDGLRHRLGCTREAVENWARQLRITVFHCPDPAAPHRLLASVTLPEARLIIRLAEAQGVAADPGPVVVTPQIIFPGYFYLLQPEPLLAPERLHVGFTIDPARTLEKIRDLAPDAAFVKVWPCERLWSQTVAASCTRDCTPLRENLFRTSDLAQVIAHADALFAVLPAAETRTRLVTRRPRASRLTRAASSTYRAQRPTPTDAPAAPAAPAPARTVPAPEPASATPFAPTPHSVPVHISCESPTPPRSPRLRVTISHPRNIHKPARATPATAPDAATPFAPTPHPIPVHVSRESPHSSAPSAAPRDHLPPPRYPRTRPRKAPVAARVREGCVQTFGPVLLSAIFVMRLASILLALGLLVAPAIAQNQSARSETRPPASSTAPGKGAKAQPPAEPSDSFSIPASGSGRKAAPATSSRLTVPDPDDSSVNLWEVVKSGGWAMYPLGFLSVVSVMMLLTFLFTLRRGAVLTPHFMNTADVLLKKKDYLGLLAISARHSEIVARIVQRSLDFATKNPTAPMEAIREIAETEGSAQAAALQHRITYLADIAVLSPMIGLLGTVFGIIRAFRKLSIGEASVSRDVLLASGVSEALIATASGLILGVAAMFFYAIFRNRVHSLISDMEIATAHIIGLLTTNFGKKRERSRVAVEEEF